MTRPAGRTKESAKNPRIGRIDASPVVRVRCRAIRDTTRLILYVSAGGRCEFDGCNKDLVDHHVTHRTGNFGQMAHICAFSPHGPRGTRDMPAPDINDVANLMLLCGACHKLIDDRPGEFPVGVLKKHKRAHEDRINLLTGVNPDRQTTAIVLKSRIDGQLVDIARDL